MPTETGALKQVTIPLEYCWRDGVVTQFANQFTIQVTSDGVCFLGFFESLPPIVLGTPEEVAEKMGDLSSLIAEGVVRVAFPIAKMPEVLSAIASTMTQLGLMIQAEQQAKVPD